MMKFLAFEEGTKKLESPVTVAVLRKALETIPNQEATVVRMSCGYAYELSTIKIDKHGRVVIE